METAFSYEGAADEASFVLGPALVGLGVSLANPTRRPRRRGRHPRASSARGSPCTTTARLTHAVTGNGPASGERLLTAALVVLCVSQFVIGTVFGSVQTGTSVLATDAGEAGLTGYLQALLGVGSVVAGLGRGGAAPELGRCRTGCGGSPCRSLVLAAPLLLVDSIPTLVPVLLALGVSIAPYMITTFTLGERITPPHGAGRR